MNAVDDPTMMAETDAAIKSLKELFQLISDKEKLLDFFENHHLLCSEMTCSNCDTKMSIRDYTKSFMEELIFVLNVRGFKTLEQKVSSLDRGLIFVI